MFLLQNTEFLDKSTLVNFLRPNSKPNQARIYKYLHHKIDLYLPVFLSFELKNENSII